MKRAIGIIVFLLTVLVLRAQVQAFGVVEDAATRQPIGGASVTLLRQGKPLKFTRTNGKGEFRMDLQALQAGDSLQAVSMGYAKKRVVVVPDGPTRILMSAEAFVLNEVKVRAGRVFGRQDTTVYDLTRFATERDNSLKDVLRKLPGVEVDDDGSLQVNGKELSRFTVEGLDLTGGRYNQLEENIKARDVKEAEIIEHDQPVKALRDKILTDAVAMNIVLKDEARDKLLPTLRPYALVGEPTHVGGEAHVLQIGKKRQWMYGAAYDRTGRDLAQETNVLANYKDGLSARSLPSWFSLPSLVAPIDAGRLRFNTSQRYGANRIQTTESDGELRFTANYLRTVERQDTRNESVYDLGMPLPVVTNQKQHLALRHDGLSLELEHKVNTPTAYGKNLLQLSARKADALADLNDTLSQRVRRPELNIAAGFNRLYTVDRGQWSLQSVLDYHHSAARLCVDREETRLQTNLWHAAAAVSWLGKRLYLTRQYTAGADVQNLNVQGDNALLSLYLAPYWQYERAKWKASFSPKVSWERYTRQRQSFFLWHPSVYVRWQPGFHSEWTFTGSYSESLGEMGEFAVRSYRQDYRTYYESRGLIPQTASLYATLGYVYKRPVQEFFLNAHMAAERNWCNTVSDLRIAEGVYHISLTEHHTHGDFFRAEATLSKGIYDWHLKMRLGSSFVYAGGWQMSGGSLLGYRSRTYGLMPSIEFAPAWGALSYQGDFQWQNSSVMETLSGWRQSLSLTSTTGPVDLTWSMTHYRNELQEGHVLNALIADAKAVWRMKKLRLTAMLSNLFNRREYTVSQYSGVSVFTDYYVLRGRELLISMQFSF
ncbi:carboxypeptidase-like regulatory domain-containing protein [Prevotella sp. KH2C16]|uniref:carboxypeptidase-like regulatory domain-containing protein n=1 Tax=Prevotella sp. KH2C16 TaxID=1855325 RepID=UPI0008F174C2|nr:carboxypeptidase-like regulatory domain-containing protein [Prevotella sp. KH2C16]SFF87260.1 hypothetical protein SAMN05216383_101308 [Prevotella sp. KH2C16]